jgi:hypothetical protein
MSTETIEVSAIPWDSGGQNKMGHYPRMVFKGLESGIKVEILVSSHPPRLIECLRNISKFDGPTMDDLAAGEIRITGMAELLAENERLKAHVVYLKLEAEMRNEEWSS